MEAGPPVEAKRMYKILRVVLLMIQKGATKSKIMLDLHLLLMKRGKIVVKALNDMVIHHCAALSCGCRSHDDVQASFVPHREYEFSCSNSPAFQPYMPFHVGSRHRTWGRRPYNASRQNKHHVVPANYGDDERAVAAAEEEEEEELKDEVSPLVRQVRRRVRVTDSPFPLVDDDEKDRDCHVDKEAEEFIQRFYNQLRLQKCKAPRRYG